MANDKKYCDLVMKGGITSGIVYPSAVIELAKRHTFKNIGGTSAGAIAAAATAAAALGERRKAAGAGGTSNVMLGFSGLAHVASRLKTRGFIFSLFQPAFGTRALFRMTATLAAKPGWVRSIWTILRTILVSAPLEILFAGLLFGGIAFLVAGWDGVAATALPSFACALLAGAMGGVFRAGRALKRNAMGMCPGTSRRRWLRKSKPALSNWLHAIIQDLSGQKGTPLLFEDLWTGPRGPDEPGDRAITLQMITTSVSHREPRSLPFEQSTFWFLREEFNALFPREVVDWMADQDAAPVEVGGKTYFELPRGGRLPVIVAARMSLSFPVLISAVPLHEPDWSKVEKSDAAETREVSAPSNGPAGALETTEALTAGGGQAADKPVAFRRCWISDGGIGSNFPIHLFDAPLPRWPTFAIDLTYSTGAVGEDGILLPCGNNQGWQPRYEQIESHIGLAQISAFLMAIVVTMQNWRDILQSRAPGHRDRIIRFLSVPAKAE